MDWVDISLKFSSELLVIGFALLVGGFNIFLFSGNQHYTDNSHAAKLLSYHIALNPKFYGKLTSVNTVVVAENGIFSKAQADDFAGLTSNITEPPKDIADDSSIIINNGSIVRPNLPTSELIAKQVKIYETKPGDTLQSIAKENGISEQTIMWANNLAGNSVKSGWQLIILPTNGILVKADSNTTLPDIAKKFSVSIETIISYNGLASAEDIEDGQLIIVPGGTITPPPAPKPIPKPTPKTPKPNDGKVKAGNVAVPREFDAGTGHLFPWGYCTWYVATRVHVPWGGNAKAWLANAKAYGALVTNEPATGTILVTNDSRKYGHVAFVEKVTENSIVVSEMNYEKFGKVDSREIPLDSPIIKGFIHP